MRMFDPKPYLEIAEMLVNNDEALLALKVLDSVPGFYRDNQNKELLNYKAYIRNKLFTHDDYGANVHDNPRSDEQNLFSLNNTARGLMIKKWVEDYNKEVVVADEVIPHIIEFGPGEYWLPLGLKAAGLTFTYYGKGVNAHAENVAKERLGSLWNKSRPYHQPSIFVATEIIEHLIDETEIRRFYDRQYQEKHADKLIISTPRYTFDANDRWHQEGIGHIRTYCPNEFISTVQRMFPEFSFSYFDDTVMVLLGELKK